MFLHRKRLSTVALSILTGLLLTVTAQNLSFSNQKLPLKKVFEQIEAKSDYRIAYNSNQVDTDRIVDFGQVGNDVKSVLIKALEGSGCSFSIDGKYIVITQGAAKKDKSSTTKKTISGIVYDEEGEPVIGATVMERGTSNGVSTDLDGKFTLSVSPTSTVDITCIGNQKWSAKADKGDFSNIVLVPDSKVLDEAVVVGYGVQRKSDLTGSVASVNSKSLEKRPAPNIIQSLQGTVPGLNISLTGSDAEGSSSSIMIRGQKSISANSTPLIILDGVPFDGAWSEINPNDIESIEVLKDASSSAIYGARGANGVILVTTKQGEKGKLAVNFDMYFTVDKAINIPRVMNGEEFYKYKYEALKEANTTTPTPDNPEPWMGSFTPTELAMHADGRSTDWVDLALQTGVKQFYNLSFRGGVNKTNYFVSLNLTDVKGIARGNQFKRYNIRLNLQQEFTSWLKFFTNTQFGRYDRGGSSAYFPRAFQMVPLSEPYNEDGTIKSVSWEDSSEAFCVNPLDNLQIRNTNIRNKLITNNGIEIKLPFLPGFSYKLNTGFTYQNSDWRQYEGNNCYYGAKYNGRIQSEEWHTQDWLLENIITYQRDFGKHRVFFTGLYSAQSYTRESTSLDGKDFPNDVMYYYQISKAGTLSGSSTYLKQNHISQMARLNYSYDSRYLVTLTVRRDGYSAFGDKSKFGVFPSMALGWNITNEDFFRRLNIQDIVSNLKYRLSWGKNGNEAISAYTTLPQLSTFNYLKDDHSPAFGFYPNKLASPNLGWETTKSLNTGIDFMLWNGRLQGSLDLYWSTTSDLLLSRSIPTINGTGTITENIGKTKNNGIELQITSNNIATRDFEWSTTFTLQHDHSEIVNVGLYDENGKPMDDVASKWFIGQPVQSNYDYKIVGIWQIADPANPKGQQDPAYRYSIPGYVRYLDADGQNDITVNDRVLIGSAVPKIRMGLSNSFRYKGVYLSFLLTSQLGQTAPNELLTVSHNSYRQNRLLVDFWTPENPNAKYPKNALDNSVNPMDANFYEKTDFLRISDVTLGYKLPQRLSKKALLNNVEVYMNIKNLATWTKWGGLDPEFISNQRAIPQTRSFTFGLKLEI